MHGSKNQSGHLTKLVLPGMTADEFIVQLKKIGQFAHLKTVARGDHHAIVAVLQFLDNGSEKWDVWRVVQIDPNLRFRMASSRLVDRFWCSTHVYYLVQLCSHGRIQLSILAGLDRTPGSIAGVAGRLLVSLRRLRVQVSTSRVTRSTW